MHFGVSTFTRRRHRLTCTHRYLIKVIIGLIMITRVLRSYSGKIRVKKWFGSKETSQASSQATDNVNRFSFVHEYKDSSLTVSIKEDMNKYYEQFALQKQELFKGMATRKGTEMFSSQNSNSSL